MMKPGRISMNGISGCQVANSWQNNPCFYGMEDVLMGMYLNPGNKGFQKDYGGEVVIVGISYDAKKKEHSCVIERV